MASTIVILNNKTEGTIDRYSYKDFSGSDSITSPKLVDENSGERQFIHKGDDRNSSVGGVAYNIQGSIKWVVAWKNAENAPNKVCTEIVDKDNIDWGHYKSLLESPDSTYVDSADAYGFRSSVKIDKAGAKPQLTAILFISDGRISNASTLVDLSNKTEKELNRSSFKDFLGTDAGKSPVIIKGNGDQKTFTHIANDKNSSVGGVAYTIQGTNVKWIVAWTNVENAPNKVVTQIVNVSNIDWGLIQNQLQASDSAYVHNAEGYGYRSEVKIDEIGTTPNLKATLFSSN